jgi:hypothetical protein
MAVIPVATMAVLVKARWKSASCRTNWYAENESFEVAWKKGPSRKLW